MTVDYKFMVDLARPTKSNTLLCMQGDYNSRVAHFFLMDNGDKFDMTDAEYVTVTAVTPNSDIVAGQATIVTEEDDDGNTVNTNEITYAIPSAMTSATGKTSLMLTIMAADAQLSSFEFYINTRNELYDASDVDTDSMSGFKDLLNEALAAVAKIEKYKSSDKFPNPYPIKVKVYEDGSVVTYAYDGNEDSGIVTVPSESDESLALHSDLEDLSDSFNTQIGGLYFAQDDDGNWGYKTSATGTIIPFKHPTGDATTADVLSGKIFSSADIENGTGTMTDNGSVSKSLSGGETYTGEGYYSSLSISRAAQTTTFIPDDVNSTADDMGADNDYRYVDTSVPYAAGYAAGAGSGYADGYKAGYSAGKKSVSLVLWVTGTTTGGEETTPTYYTATYGDALDEKNEYYGHGYHLKITSWS